LRISPLAPKLNLGAASVTCLSAEYITQFPIGDWKRENAWPNTSNVEQYHSRRTCNFLANFTD